LDQEKDLQRLAELKVPVEQCLSLSAKGWARRPGAGTWRWEKPCASVGYSFDPTLRVLRLHYSLERPGEQEPHAVDYSLPMVAEPTRFGGLRWWFLCPVIDRGAPCHRRVGKLYLPPGALGFGCRHCHRLTYASRQESRKMTARAAALWDTLKPPEAREPPARLPDEICSQAPMQPDAVPSLNDAQLPEAAPAQAEAEKGPAPPNNIPRKAAPPHPFGLWIGGPFS
jgi:hypothetical protein